jgi:hypothetical protein
MAQQYRLRLAEGTLLVVDHDALTTWLVDEKALVQPVGAKRWRLLKQFLADERAGDISANYWEELPPEQRRRRQQAPKQETTSVFNVVSGWFGGGKQRPAAPQRELSPTAHTDDMTPLLRALRKAEIPLDVPSTPPPLSPDILQEAQPFAAEESAAFQLPQEEEVVSISEAAMAESVADSSAAADWNPEAEETPFYGGSPTTSPEAEAAAPQPESEPEPQPEPEPEIEITLNKLRPPLDVDAPPAPMPAMLARLQVAPPEPAASPVGPADLERDLEVTINKPLPPELMPGAKPRAAAPPPRPILPPEPTPDLERTVNKQRVPPPPSPPAPPVMSAELERDLEVTINKQLPPELMPGARPRATPPPRPILPPEPGPDVEKTVNKQRVPPPEPIAPAVSAELERSLEITINKPLPPELIAARPKPRVEAPPRPVPPPEPAPVTPEPEAPIAPVLSEDAERLRAATSAWLSTEDTRGRESPPRSPAPQYPPVSSPPSVGAPPALQTLADDTGPSIRLKPLATDAPAPEVREEEESVEKVVWGSGPMGRILCLVAEWSGHIEAWLEMGKAAWARRKTSHRAPVAASQRDAAAPGLLAAWLEIIAGWAEKARAWMASRRRAPQATLSDLLYDDLPPTAPARRRTTTAPSREEMLSGPVASIEEDFDASDWPPRRVSPPAAPKIPSAMPPPPIDALPTLRLAELPPEPEQEEDLYDDSWESSGTLGLWVKRIVLAALVLAVLLAASSWRAWWPGLKEHGAALNTSLEAELEKKRQARAFEVSMAQFPHLDARTVRLLMSSDAPDVTAADPLEVFRRAYDAADRGLPALAPEEATELTALRGRLLAILSAREQERLRDYDRARHGRGTLPYEDHDALELVARATNALEPASRTRLQTLNGNAIAAALAQSKGSVAPR